MNKYLSLFVLAAMVTTEALAEKSEIPPFAMTVLLDQAQGNKIVNGSFERAIDKLTANSSKASRHEKLTNLCVAYAKTKQIDAALESCDAAIEVLKAKIERYDNRPASSFISRRVVLQSDLSIALSNRGVLFAVTGDTTRAREYFQAAIDLPVNRSKARTNLQRLTAEDS